MTVKILEQPFDPWRMVGAHERRLRAGGHGVTFRGRGGEIVAGYFPMPRDFS